jgi:surface carbohydrate biosynthesis protein
MQSKKFIIKNDNVICFPIEIKVREFLSKIFLAYKLVKYTNFKVIFGGQRFINNKLIFQDCIWLDKNTFYKQRERFPIHRYNKIIMLDEEGPISFFANSTLKLRYNNKIIKQVTAFLFSGKKDIKNLNKKFLKNSYKIIGNPKFDLLKKKNWKVYELELKYIKEKFKNYLFIPGHFTSIKTNKDFESESNLLFSNNFQRKEYVQNYEVYFNNYIRLLNLVKKIAIQNPKLTIIFRRHPAESEFFIKKYFRDRPSNLKLIYKFNITPWIIACGYYLHSGCQSYLEALTLKKKIISYYPIKYYHTDNFYLSRPIFYNEEKCLDFFKKDFLLPKVFSIKNKERYLLVKNIEDKVFFFKIFIDYIEKNFKSINSQILLKSKKNKFFIKISNFVYSFLSKFKNYLIEKKFFYILTKFFSYEDLISKKTKNIKFKSLLKSEILHYLNIFKKIDKSKIQIVVKKIDQNVFCLYKKLNTNKL